MPAPLDDWLDQHWDRAFAHHSAQVATVKLLVTFSLGISATIVATALQVDPNGWLDTMAIIILGAAFAAAIAAIVLDRMKLVDRKVVLAEKQAKGWDDPTFFASLRSLMGTMEDENELVVRRVRKAAEYQVLLSSAAAILAVVSLLN